MSLEADALADRRRLRRKLSFWRIAAFLIVLVAVLVGFGIANEDTGLLPRDHVARVEITGLIADDRDRRKLLRQIADNGRAKALILAIDSPGGTTTGAEALYESIREVAEKKPVVATLGTLAASGGYIAAIGADHIVARGNTLAGSIGVLVQWPNATELLDKVGVSVRSVKSSPIKAEPTPYTDPPPEAIAVLERVVADSYDWFIDLVAERRNLTAAEARAVGDASIFTGRDALEVKLVDEIGGEDTARAWLESEHGIDDDTDVRTYKARDGIEGWPAGEAILGTVLRSVTGGLVERLAPGGTALDGLISVWHPDPAK